MIHHRERLPFGLETGDETFVSMPSLITLNAMQIAGAFFRHRGKLHRRASEKAVSAFVGGDERGQASEESNIRSASLRQKRAMFGGRLREHIRENRLFARGYPVHGDRKFGGKEVDRVLRVKPGRD